MKNKFETDIKLGTRYRDTQTGIEGTATAVTFYQFGCERVQLEAVIAGKIEEYAFDAPRLIEIDSGEQVRQTRTGGDRSGIPSRGMVQR